MRLTEDTVNQIAWMCGLDPEQVVHFKDNIRNQDVLRFYDKPLGVAEQRAAHLLVINEPRQEYHLWIANSSAKKTLKPFIQILKGLAEQGEIYLFVTGGTRQASLI